MLGAVVGGGIAATVAWMQTRVMLGHELDLLHKQLEADREAGRAALRRTAATDALAVLATLDASMPYVNYRFAALRRDAPGYQVDRRRRAELALTELRRVEVASIPLLGEAMLEQWASLRREADEAAHPGGLITEEPDEAAGVLASTASKVYTTLIEMIQKD